MAKKVRKPRDICKKKSWVLGLRTRQQDIHFYSCGWGISLNEAKKIRDWLTRAIEWLEAQRD